VSVILSNNPIRDASGDEFGFRAHAEVLCRAIAEVHDLPLTPAIFGSRGSGKTSRHLIKRLGWLSVAGSNHRPAAASHPDDPRSWGGSG
jgi:hypothetical protein